MGLYHAIEQRSHPNVTWYLPCIFKSVIVLSVPLIVFRITIVVSTLLTNNIPGSFSMAHEEADVQLVTKRKSPTVGHLSEKIDRIIDVIFPAMLSYPDE